MDDAPRARLNEALEGIHGWLTLDEARQLHEEVRGLARRMARPLTIVEIGSWKGRSAVAMSLGLEAAGAEGTLHAIDPQAEPHDNFEEFMLNLKAAGVERFADPIRKLSHDARPDFDGVEIDLLFVDGAHDYVSVCRDLDDWTPLLADGGVLVLNDIFLPGVVRASLERVARHGSAFRSPRYVYNTILFDYRPTREISQRDVADLRRTRLFLRYGRRWLRAWNRLKDDPSVPLRVKAVFYRPTSRLLWWLGPKPS